VEVIKKSTIYKILNKLDFLKIMVKKKDAKRKPAKRKVVRKGNPQKENLQKGE